MGAGSTSNIDNALEAYQMGLSPEPRAEMSEWGGRGGGVPDRIRTCDPLLRRQPLYPLSYRDVLSPHQCTNGGTKGSTRPSRVA